MQLSCKMIVTDLDGTLLQNNGTLSAHTRSVLRRCRSANIKIVIATARPFRRVAPFLDDMPCDAVICHNGAAIYEGKTKRTDFAIPATEASAVLRGLHLRYPHMTLLADSDERLYANFEIPAAWEKIHAAPTNFESPLLQPAEAIYAGVDREERMEEIRLLLPESLAVQKLSENFMQIVNRQAAKHNALKILSETFAISLRDTLAFGDDRNDIGMLRVCGKGIAVANAIDEVKAAADERTAGNEDDGVARYMEAVLLSQ